MLSSKTCVGVIGVMSGLPAVLTEFTKSLVEMTAFNHHYLCGPDQFVETIWPPHSFHSVARNQMAKMATAEWICMLDTDHSFSCDLLFRLLNSMRLHNAEVASALYCMKEPPHHPAAWDYRASDGTISQYVEWPEDEKVKVDVVGAGCLLIKTNVFRRIWDELGEEPFSTQEFPGVVGEDFAFCRRCERLGIPILLDTAIQCNHLQIKPVVYGVDNDVSAVPTKTKVTQKVLVAA